MTTQWMRRMYQEMSGEADEAREAARVSNLVRTALEASPTSSVPVGTLMETTGLSKPEILGVLDDETLVCALDVAFVEYHPSSNTIEIGPRNG